MAWAPGTSLELMPNSFITRMVIGPSDMLFVACNANNMYRIPAAGGVLDEHQYRVACFQCDRDGHRRLIVICFWGTSPVFLTAVFIDLLMMGTVDRRSPGRLKPAHSSGLLLPSTETIIFVVQGFTNRAPAALPGWI